MDFGTIFVPFWNCKNLESPAVVSMTLNIENAGGVSDKLYHDLNKIVSVLENQDLLHLEAAVLSRLLFRHKKLFRKDKGYQGSQKVYRTLRSYLSLDLIRVLAENRSVSNSGQGPSREMMECCLVKLLQFSALFFRIEKNCMDTVKYFNSLIETGTRWNLALMFLATLSRIWVFSRYLLQLSCDWYSLLKSYLPSLELKEHWLPKNYELPEDLQSWLGKPDFLKDSNRNEVVFSEPVPPLSLEKTKMLNVHLDEDFGEVISRGSSSSVTPQNLNTDIIRKPKDIDKFFRNEEMSRKRKHTSSTNDVNENQWTQLNKYLSDISNTNDNKAYSVNMKKAKKK